MLGDDLYRREQTRAIRKQVRAALQALARCGSKILRGVRQPRQSNERFYKSFNMDGQQYYTYKKGNVRFFALDSNYMNPQQLAWLEKELQTQDRIGKSAISITRSILPGPSMALRSNSAFCWNPCS